MLRGTNDVADQYPRAYEVSIDVRMRALEFVLECVKKSYGGDKTALRNVAALVDGVADAVAKGDRASALIRGLRLLSEAELVDLWHRLGGE